MWVLLEFSQLRNNTWRRIKIHDSRKEDQKKKTKKKPGLADDIEVLVDDQCLQVLLKAILPKFRPSERKHHPYPDNNSIEKKTFKRKTLSKRVTFVQTSNCKEEKHFSRRSASATSKKPSATAPERNCGHSACRETLQNFVLAPMKLNHNA